MTNSSTTIIVVVLIVVMFMAPTILEQGFQGIRDFFGDFRDAWLGDWGDGSNGEGTIGLTVNYKDGSTKDFESGGLSIFPLTIADSGGDVQSFIITVGIRATHTFSRALGYTMKVLDFDAKVINDKDELIGYLAKDLTKTKSVHSEWKSGYAYGQSMGEFEATQLDSILSTQPYGEYTLEMTADVTLELTSADSGDIATRSGSGSASWLFSYTSEGEIESLSVTINTYPYRI